MGFVVKEWYSQAPIRGRDIFCADAKERTGEQFRVPCVQIIYGLYSSNRHRQIGALLSGSNSSARFDLTPTNFLFARQRGASLLSFPVRPPKDINSDLTREEAMDARSIIHIYSYDAKEVKLYLRG